MTRNGIFSFSFTQDPLQNVMLGIDLIFRLAIPVGVGVLALVGAVLVLSTRPDAFDVADRKSRNVWAGLLFGSAFFLLLPQIGWIFFGIPIIAGFVITGVYWLDVRPQIRDLLDNAQGNY